MNRTKITIGGYALSHFTKIRTRLVDEQTLRQALGRLGHEPLEARNGVKGWMGGRTQADFKIKPATGDYEIGFVKEDGAYTIVADWWGIHSTDEATFAAGLTQAYGVVGTLSTLTAQGFELGEETQEQDGTVRLTLRRSA